MGLKLELRLMPPWKAAHLDHCKRCEGPCEGPCYDYCACSHCWNGWKDVSFLRRLRWRIAEILWGRL